MVYISSCFFGFALLGSMVYTMMKKKDGEIFNKFINTLNTNQKQVYEEIKQERLRLYLQGLGLGLFLAFLSLAMLTNKKAFTRICVFTVLGLGTANVYYSMMPKKKWMLDYIETQEQASAWLDIYQEMKSRGMIGALLGLGGFILLGSSICI